MLDNINIRSRFMQKIIEKTIEKFIYKSTGANVKIRFCDCIQVISDDNTITMHLNLDAISTKEDIERLFESRS